MCTAIPMLAFPIPLTHGGVAGGAGGVAEVAGLAGAGLGRTGIHGGKTKMLSKEVRLCLMDLDEEEVTDVASEVAWVSVSGVVPLPGHM
jgi:hypothetical protein